jgi:hypothetical protein
LQRYLPARVSFDADRSLLILDLLDGWQSVYDDGADDSAFGLPRIAASVAGALAACHSMVTSPHSAHGVLATLTESPPWILSIARPPIGVLRDLSPAQLELLKVLQGQGTACEKLDQLRRDWITSHLLHGDFKWSNLLIAPNGDDPRAVKLLDWETASLGDAAWDVGAVFHAYLAHGVHEIALDEDVGAEEAARHLTARLPQAQEEMRRFWSAYVAARDVAVDESARLLERATGYCAARLLQSAWEWSQRKQHIERPAAGMLQLCVNMLERPAEARRFLLGIDTV